MHFAQLRASLDACRPCGAATIARAMMLLEEHAPATRAKLPADVSAWYASAFATLEQLVDNAHRFSSLEGPLAQLGRSGAVRTLEPADHRAVCDALLEALSGMAGEAWRGGLLRDWQLLLDAASGAMLVGAMSAGRVPAKGGARTGKQRVAAGLASSAA